MERSVLNTERVKTVTDKLGVTALVADWTDRDAEIGDLLARLGAKQLPVIAVFPGDNPNQPIVIATGLYTQNQIVNALQEAGPSLDVAENILTVSHKTADLWETFDRESAEKLLEEGNTLLVFATADWHLSANLIEPSMSSESGRIREFMARHNLHGMLVDNTNSDAIWQEWRAFAGEHRFEWNPDVTAGVFYLVDRADGEVSASQLWGAFTADALIEKLRELVPGADQ